MNHFRTIVLSLALLLPASAHAEGSMISQMVSMVSGIFTGIPWGIVDIMQRFAKSIEAENNKANTAIKNAIESAADYTVQERTRMALASTAEALIQPANTCSAMAAGEASLKGQSFTRSLATTSAKQDTNALAYGAPMDTRAASLNKRSRTYCTTEDYARGRCDKPAAAQLAGADIEASYLFSSPDGTSDTFIKGQKEATNLYIERVLSVKSPDPLKDPAWERTPQGRAYVEMQRRYAAINSMAAYSLHSIAASRTPLVPQ